MYPWLVTWVRLRNFICGRFCCRWAGETFCFRWSSGRHQSFVLHQCSQNWGGRAKQHQKNKKQQLGTGAWAQCNEEVKCTFSGEVLCSVHGLPAQVAHHVVHSGLVAQEDGPNHLVVDDLGSIPRHWSHAPQQEETLQAQSSQRFAFVRSKTNESLAELCLLQFSPWRHSRRETSRGKCRRRTRLGWKRHKPPSTSAILCHLPCLDFRWLWLCRRDRKGTEGVRRAKNHFLSRVNGCLNPTL